MNDLIFYDLTTDWDQLVLQKPNSQIRATYVCENDDKIGDSVRIGPFIGKVVERTTRGKEFKFTMTIEHNSYYTEEEGI